MASVVMASAAVGVADGEAARREAERAQVARTLADLEEVVSLLPSNLEPAVRFDARRAVGAGRIALVYSVWGPDAGAARRPRVPECRTTSTRPPGDRSGHSTAV